MRCASLLILCSSAPQSDRQCRSVSRLATPRQHIVTPEPDFGLPFAVTSVDPGSVSLSSPPLSGLGSVLIRIRGGGFQATPRLAFLPAGIPIIGPFFRSDSLLVATLNLS